MKYFLILIGLLGFQFVVGQTHSRTTVSSIKNKSDKFIKITVKDMLSLKMEGYNGDDIVLESSTSIPVSASNLKEISPAIPGQKIARGLNSPYTQENAGSFSVFFQGDHSKAYILRLPKNVHVSITQMAGDSLMVENLGGEVEVRTDASFVIISHIGGSLMLNARSLSPGRKQIIISDLLKTTGNQSGRTVNVLSVNHDIDISVDKKWPFTFEITVPHGDVYSNLDMRTRSVKTKKENRISGQMNGGGLLFQIRSEYGNVYLRKQEATLMSF